jgi:hypothetical protein
MTSRTFGERPKLSEAQASLYLERLGVSVSDVRARPKDHALLSELMCVLASDCPSEPRTDEDDSLAQLFTIPFESNRIHISDDAFARGDDAEPIKFLSGPGLPGAYCALMSHPASQWSRAAQMSSMTSSTLS